MTIYVDSTTTPNLAQLSGTPFVAAEVLPVVGVPGAQSVQYGDPLSFTVTTADVGTGHTLTLRARGLPAGLSFLDLGDGAGMVLGTVTAPTGPYTASFTASDGVSDSPAGTVAISVTPAPLTATANNASSAYGGPLPQFSATFSGLAGSDTTTSEQAKTGCTTTATASSPVLAGGYPITCTTSDLNYSPITYVAGTLTINPAPLTITASSASMAYGGTVPLITPKYIGLANGDTNPATPPTCTTTATSSSPVGTYPTICSGAAGPNYSIDSSSYVAGTLTVNPAPLTIAADNKQMSYGGTLPPLSWTANFVNGGTASALTTQPSCATAPATSPAGSYGITCSGAADPNYTIGYAKGTLTINQAPLTITASSGAMAYGGTVPAITASFGGLVGGDTAASESAKASCATTASAGSPVNSYPTSCTLADANYTPTFVNGAVKVNPAPLTITASSATMVLHGTVPAITPSYSGFVGNESAASLAAGPTCTTAATSSSPAGTYPTTCSGAVDANYSIGYVAGTVTVTYLIKALYDQTQDKHSGSNVPIKLQVQDAAGTNLSSSSIVVTLSTPALSPSPSPGVQPGGTFSDAGPMYRYNVKATSYPNHAYTLSFTVAGDPVVHSLQFVIG